MDGVEDHFTHNGEVGVENFCSFLLEDTDHLVELEPLLQPTYQNHLQVEILVPHFHHRQPELRRHFSVDVLVSSLRARPEIPPLLHPFDPSSKVLDVGGRLIQVIYLAQHVLQ